MVIHCHSIVTTVVILFLQHRIIVEWLQKGFITLTPAYNGTKLITTVKKFTGRAPEQEVEEKLSQQLKRKRDKRYRKQKCFAD